MMYFVRLEVELRPTLDVEAGLLRSRELIPIDLDRHGAAGELLDLARPMFLHRRPKTTPDRAWSFHGFAMVKA
jgi:hypothetical protein